MIGIREQGAIRKVDLQMFEGVVEKGQIKLPANVRLPDHTKVYVIAPDAQIKETAYIHSPRLRNQVQAADFKMEVIEGTSDVKL